MYCFHVLVIPQGRRVKEVVKERDAASLLLPRMYRCSFYSCYTFLLNCLRSTIVFAFSHVAIHRFIRTAFESIIFEGSRLV